MPDAITGQGQPAAAANEQPQPAPTQPNEAASVSVLRQNFAHLAPDGDFNKVVHMANQYQKLQTDGYAELADAANGSGMNAWDLRSVLESAPAQQSETPQFPGPQVSGVPAQTYPSQTYPPQTYPPQQFPEPVPQQYPDVSGQFVNPQQLQQILEKQQKDFTKLLDDKLGNQRQQDDRNRDINAEDAAYDSVLDTMGYKRNPQTATVEGSDIDDIDLNYDFVLRTALRGTAEDLYRRGLNPSDPDYEQKLSAPLSPEIVARAGKVVAPLLTAMGYQAQIKTAEKQANLPPATNTTGPGGRAQVDIKDMSRDQVRQMAMDKARQEGRIMREDQR